MYVTNNQANKELTTGTILDRGYDGGGVTKIQSSGSWTLTGFISDIMR
jgi:hypothetical protein